MSQNSTIYVTQRPVPNRVGWVPNLSQADRYGKLVYVFEGGKQVFSRTDQGLKHAKEMLEDFNPDHDYILWPNSGDPAALWCCQHALAGMGVPYIKYLYWERGFKDGKRSNSEGFYSPITIQF